MIRLRTIAMNHHKRWLVRGIKFVLATLVLFFVGRQFFTDLTNPDSMKSSRNPFG